MTSSLVGSEMCIRDRAKNGLIWVLAQLAWVNVPDTLRDLMLQGQVLAPVSYTHLTLPTICSV
eukprot:7649427-Prorocentrum_lima.AAC.1